MSQSFKAKGSLTAEDSRRTYVSQESVSTFPQDARRLSANPPEQPSHFGRLMLKDLFGFC